MAGNSMKEQLGFELQPQQPHDLSYFIPHSGVVEAVGLFELALDAIRADAKTFRAIYVFGPKGSGKRHLCAGYRTRARDVGMDVDLFDFAQLAAQFTGEGELSDAVVERFVSTYERLRAKGGLLISFASIDPGSLTDNPHLRSRLFAGASAQLHYPREEELRPLLSSLSERHNLRLSERTMAYLEKRIPLDPLSFEDIFDKVNRISLGEGKPASMSVVRQVLGVEAEKYRKDK